MPSFETDDLFLAAFLVAGGAEVTAYAVSPSAMGPRVLMRVDIAGYQSPRCVRGLDAAAVVLREDTGVSGARKVISDGVFRDFVRAYIRLKREVLAHKRRQA